jgi:tetratricopeptide (TPR) repeat protein
MDDIHVVGLALTFTNVELSVGLNLGYEILARLSELGCALSTMTLVRQSLHPRLAGRGGVSGKGSRRITMLTTRFEKMYESRLLVDDPNAHTLAGLLHARKGDDIRAVGCLKKALQAGSGDRKEQTHSSSRVTLRAPLWQWEVVCYRTLGQLYAKQGRRAEALAAFKIAALELDDLASILELARLLPRGEPIRREYLLKAAMSGMAEAASLYAGELRQLGETSNSEDAEHYQQQADEWARFAVSAGSP